MTQLGKRTACLAEFEGFDSPISRMRVRFIKDVNPCYSVGQVVEVTASSFMGAPCYRPKNEADGRFEGSYGPSILMIPPSCVEVLHGDKG